eukprot:TCALIF_12170-PB protein Name:"Similar to TSPAN18 Tetraspanin-18 (Homo sapiens)" AED:0.38 eAED:0.38 QI:0/0.5/0.4/0.8/1/1/5/0/238
MNEERKAMKTGEPPCHLEVERSTKSLLRSSLENHFSVGEKPNAVSLAWNFVMAEFQCCGVDNYTDFQRSRTFLDTRSSHQMLPPACCILNQEQYPPYFEPEDSNCLTAPTSYNSFFLKGCYDKLFTRILAHLNPVLITIICLVTLELLAIIFALCLSKAVDRDLRIPAAASIVLEEHEKRNKNRKKKKKTMAPPPKEVCQSPPAYVSQPSEHVSFLPVASAPEVLPSVPPPSYFKYGN